MEDQQFSWKSLHVFDNREIYTAWRHVCHVHMYKFNDDYPLLWISTIYILQ